MATSIQFTDEIGAATLTNGKVSPADRFATWTPMKRHKGSPTKRDSDNALMLFRTSTIYGATFELQNIPMKSIGGVRNVDVADRLVAHLLGGGTCTVNTGDASSTVYATCGVYPDTEPSLQLTNRQLLEYSLTLALQNLAGSPVQMVCHYV